MERPVTSDGPWCPQARQDAAGQRYNTAISRYFAYSGNLQKSILPPLHGGGHPRATLPLSPGQREVDSIPLFTYAGLESYPQKGRGFCILEIVRQDAG